uniref:UDP-glucosyltransferase 29-like n=1 Tax=Erigeron canadensis TaxID=72917 RepID=UPI001CB96CFE|nr:UDP-glucosyltransferase 29-like [Erigeron canadensis]
MTTMNGHDESKTKVLLFPWLGHGHLSPFLELAKKLSNTNLLDVYLCSTRANLDSVIKCRPPSVRLIELNLPALPELPSHLHTTNGLPVHLMPSLKQAFDMSIPLFSEILVNLKPDLLIYDIIQPWAPVAAGNLGIPSIVFITTSVAASVFDLHLKYNKGVAFPYSALYYRAGEYVEPAKDCKDAKRVTDCLELSSSLMLVKSFKEIEGKYSDYLSVVTSKKIVPVGPLVADPCPLDTKQNSVIQWLDEKAVGSTVFVSFGSEYFLSSLDLEEIAYGLELSNVNFIWVLRFPKGETNIKISKVLPLGYLERVKERGLIVEGWAPQAHILKHKNIGGFVSHCGWNSVLEAMKFGVPIIAMPMHLDQPINTRLVAEVGVGVEVVRDENRRLNREKVADVVQHVVMSKSGGPVREKAKQMSVDLSLKGNEEIDVVVEELLQLCKSGGSRDGRGNRKELQSNGFANGKHYASKD